jgi:predicted amidohydrolase YtcJ
MYSTTALVSPRSMLALCVAFACGAIGSLSDCVAAEASAAPVSPSPVASASPTSVAASNNETVLTGGRIYTPGGWQEAVAIAGGRIVATGKDAAMRERAAKNATIVELHGATVLPGLYDMHVHPLMAGNGAEGRCRIEQGADAARLLAVVAACVRAEKPGRWVTGAQWQAVSMGSTPITKQTLDTVSPDNPVMLFDISGHSLWVNSKALQTAGITRDTPDPEGGIIERDASGEPTGILRETARQIVMQHVPPPTPEENLAALRSGLDRMLAYGITGLVDAMVMREELVAYDALADAGGLRQHVQACIAYTVTGKLVPDADELIANWRRYARENFRPDCVKVFADGVPTESHTAAMLDPYADSQRSAPARGMLLIDPAVINPAVARWDHAGLTVLFHAAGDAAVRASLDAIEYARKQNGPGGPHHQVGHCTFISREDMPRARALDAAFEFSPYLWSPSPINDDIIKAIGLQRIERVWPLREGIESGALVVAGSDWAVVPEPDPWLAIETSVTRRTPGGDGTSFGPGEAISVQQALDVFTINAARRLGVDNRFGTIEPGKQADLIVIDRNPFEIPVTDIHNVQVRQVYFGGSRVYERRADGKAK